MMKYLGEVMLRRASNTQTIAMCAGALRLKIFLFHPPRRQAASEKTQLFQYSNQHVMWLQEAIAIF
jgi:hypothetical protein